MSGWPMVTYFDGKKLSDCSNGEIINAIKLAHEAHRSCTITDDTFHAILNEGVERQILPDAMWLVDGS